MKFIISKNEVVLEITYKDYEINIADYRNDDGVRNYADIRVYDIHSGDDVTSVICRILGIENNYIMGTGEILNSIMRAIRHLYMKIEG